MSESVADQGLVFFSGGTAMNPIARQLKQYTSLHHIQAQYFLTPFDSGGSSAELRRHFAVPALGDLRSRLLALSNPNSSIHTDRVHLLEQRLHGERSTLKTILQQRTDALQKLPGDDPNWSWLCMHMQALLLQLPDDFDLFGASLGNLMMCAGLVLGQESLQQISQRFALAVDAQGRADCIVSDNLHLAARLADGRNIIGQHRLTGKNHAPINLRITDSWLSTDAAYSRPATCQISVHTANIIRNASLIVYCPGSFHSSLMAQFLPRGVGTAIAQSSALKLYMPNLGHDPELYDCSPEQALNMLIQRLQADLAHAVRPEMLVNTLLLQRGGESHYKDFKTMRLIAAELRSASTGHHDPVASVEQLRKLIAAPPLI